jgi:hypothetical protein
MAWRTKADRPRLARPALASLCSCLLALSLTGSAAAAPDSETNKARLDDTVRFLEDAQSNDGGFGAGGSPTEPSEPDFTAWVALALAADGINPRDQATPGGTSSYAYLVAHAGALKSTTDLERALLVVDASGTSPEEFGSVRLVTQILARQLTGTPEEGAFEPEADQQTPAVNATIFAILALSPVRETAVQAAIESALRWLLKEQSTQDHGWPAVCPRTVAGCSEEDEVDMTGAAIQALNAAGLHDSEAQAEALDFLRTAQNADGGFSELPSEHESNSASTSWAVQAIWSAGENPETWLIPGTGGEPLDYLESMQHEDGSVQWKANSDENPMLMTAYAAAAYAGDYLPIPAPPYEQPPASPAAVSGAAQPSPGSAESGNGGDSVGAGSGVIAGGGGRGAPLFSRPQPGSTGDRPGGARQRGHAAAKPSPADHPRSPSPPRQTAPPAIAPARSSPERAGPGTGNHAPGSGSVAHGAAASATALPSGDGSGPAGGQVIKGVLIAAPGTGQPPAAIESGAPGLRSAGAGGSETPWLAIAIGAAIALLILTGSQLERRRPQVIL